LAVGTEPTSCSQQFSNSVGHEFLFPIGYDFVSQYISALAADIETAVQEGKTSGASANEMLHFCNSTMSSFSSNF